MNLPRRDPLTIEQATLNCPACGELLAIVEALGNSHEVIYLWHPGKEDGSPPPPRCHENGVTAWQAWSAYTGDRCSDYRSAIIDTYTWPDRDSGEPMPELADDEEPVLEQLTDEQMALLL